jgi:predicted O-methyltransferase YrrM
MPFAWSRKSKSDGRPIGFEGRYYNQNPGVNWSPYIPLQDKPITYLEIGCADGGNAIHIANSYCKHPQSKIYCVDPWMDYEEYPEYKGQQDIGWRTFNKNIQNSGHISKFVVNRGFSDDVVPTFQDEFFDLIFVDGNHETDYVYRDGVMSLQKAKKGGYIVFDDYTPIWWPQTVKGVDMFLKEYSSKIQIVVAHDKLHQLIVKKKW